MSELSVVGPRFIEGPALAVANFKGIYPPLPTFFDAREELDLATYRQHISNLAETGIAGYVVMGTNGESVHLTSDERVQVIEAAREGAGSDAQIIAGCGEQSTRATITNCWRAATAGANAALVLPPSYYKSLMDRRALVAHYQAIADSSPLPVVIYNMPASAADLDIDAATICILAEHPNIIGVKDSAGNMAKLAQVTGQVPASFRVFAARRLEEARTLQAQIVAANTAVTTTYGVPGLKAALELTAGSDGRLRADCGSLRSPLQPLTEQERVNLLEILRRVPQTKER